MHVCSKCHVVLSEASHSPCNAPAVEAEITQLSAALSKKFTDVAPFARGKTGTLFRATHSATGVAGVLKLVDPAVSGSGSERLRLKRELRKQTTLTGAVLVPLLDGGEDGQLLWLFREFVEGQSLASHLAQRGALPAAQALSIAAQVAVGLDELHRNGLLHRDLKPDHVLLQAADTGTPAVRLVDAGLPPRIGSEGVFDLMGTPGYMSPEQAAGRIVSFRSDLYSLGCLLHELATGVPLFSGDTAEVLAAQREALVPDVDIPLPDAARDLLRALLDKEPRRRPFSAQQVRRTLEPLLEAPLAVTAAPRAAREKARGFAGATVPPPPPKLSGRPEGTQELHLDDVLVAGPPPHGRPTEHLQTAELSALSVDGESDEGRGTEILDTSEIEIVPVPGRPTEHLNTREIRALVVEDGLEGAADPAASGAPAVSRPSSIPPPVPGSVRSPATADPIGVRSQSPASSAGDHSAPSNTDPGESRNAGVPGESPASSAGDHSAPSNTDPGESRNAGVPGESRPPSTRAESVGADERGGTHTATPEVKRAQDGSVDNSSAETAVTDGPPPQVQPESTDSAEGTGSSADSSLPAGEGAVQGAEQGAQAAAAFEKPPQPEASIVFAHQAQAQVAGAQRPGRGASKRSVDFDVESLFDGEQTSQASRPAATSDGDDEGADDPTIAMAAAAPVVSSMPPALADPVEATDPGARARHGAESDEGPTVNVPPEDMQALARASQRPEGAATGKSGIPIWAYGLSAVAIVALLVWAAGGGKSATQEGQEGPISAGPGDGDRASGAVAQPPAPRVLPATAHRPAGAKSGTQADGKAVAASETPATSGQASAGPAVAMDPAVATESGTQGAAPQASRADSTGHLAPTSGAHAAQQPPVPADDGTQAAVPSGIDPAGPGLSAPLAAGDSKMESPTKVAGAQTEVSAKTGSAAKATEPTGAGVDSSAESRAVPATKRRSANKADAAGYKADARAHFASKRYKRAVRAYKRATMATPSDAGAFAGLGASQLAVGKPKAAVASYQRAVQLRSKSSGFHAALGRAYYESGDKRRALAAYRKSLDLNPDNRAAKAALKRLSK